MRSIQKITILILTLCMCLGSGSCSPERMNAARESDDEEAAQKEAETIKPIGSDPMSLPPYSYDLEERNWDEEGITIKYPVIINSNMLEATEAANELIRNDIRNVIDVVKSDNSDGTLAIDAVYDYQKYSPACLSIKYVGSYYGKSSVYPVHFYHTITISLDSAAVVPLSDLFVIDETFVETFKMGMYAPYRDDLDLEASGVDITTAISEQYSNNQLIALFAQADAAYYLTDQGVILSVEVPHALGDHLEMAVRYEFLEINMKRDHPFWKDYMYLSEGDA